MQSPVRWGPDAYASWGRRLGALLLDGLVLGSASLLILTLAVGAGYVAAARDGAVTMGALAFAVVIVGQYAYHSVFVHRLGATPGKHWLGIEVRTVEGTYPSLPLALGRALAQNLSGQVFALGYLWALWDEASRTWHDLLCQTFVVDRARVTAAASGSAGPWHPVRNSLYAQAVSPARTAGTAAGDHNRAAIRRAGLGPEAAAWLEQVAGQVDSRLDRLAPGWRERPQAEAARSAVFGLLLGALANRYPHTATDLARVAEVHPGFAPLLAGSRLATLQQIAAAEGRVAAWLDPLVSANPVERGRYAALLA